MELLHDMDMDRTVQPRNCGFCLCMPSRMRRVPNLGARMTRNFVKLAAMLFAGLATLATHPALAQGTGGDSWTERKCVLYTAAWNHIASNGAPDGVSEEFLADHDAFLASGCLDRGHVCPRSPRELEIADMLSLMAVAEGMAGSFLPFNCTD